MNKTLACALSACVLAAGGAAMRAASAQDGTQQPGQSTQARVWIQNRGETETVPVSIQNVASIAPLRVELTGDPVVTLGTRSVVQTLAARQPWEYRSLRVLLGQDPAPALNAAGADGWEATGVALTDQGGTLVVMKRPR